MPRILYDDFGRICKLYPETDIKFKAVGRAMYSTKPYKLGYPQDGCASAYYPGSPDITKEEIKTIQDVLQSRELFSENTRLSKSTPEMKGDSHSNTVFHLMVAAAETSQLPVPEDLSDLTIKPNTKLLIIRGDHSRCLSKVVSELEAAKNYANNSIQCGVIDALIETFKTGNHQLFKKAQELWVKDTNPTIESIIGFIETYQDPYGVRGAWEGIVAVINKTRSKIYAELVERSSEFLACLPWNSTAADLPQSCAGPFENPRFVQPEFISLDSMSLIFCLEIALLIV